MVAKVAWCANAKARHRRIFKFIGALRFFDLFRWMRVAIGDLLQPLAKSDEREPSGKSVSYSELRFSTRWIVSSRSIAGSRTVFSQRSLPSAWSLIFV
ncbi:hypothetical protein [Caballeronia arationis]|uniref:hypothetical protein n=1 Tax=Caballeronia arationis TaxID=1777142 RepID=UPI0011982776|nr:hypothetical protein [Caballeronia arationis]